MLCVTPAKSGVYYLTHLPVLTGWSQLTTRNRFSFEVYIIILYIGQTVDDSVDSSIIRSGDLVQVELDVEIFRMMQEGHGGWNDAMVEVRVESC